MKTIFSVLFITIGLAGFATTWTITTPGNGYSPAAITISFGDSVNFSLASIHDAREVNKATWNANGSTALAGGFQTAFGGGLVLPAQLGVDTHYYVCSAHFSMGMKGMIIVQSGGTSISENQLQADISIFPNPANGIFQLSLKDFIPGEKPVIEIHDTQGNRIYQSIITNATSRIDLTGQACGIYIVTIHSKQAILTRKITIQ